MDSKRFSYKLYTIIGKMCDIYYIHKVRLREMKHKKFKYYWMQDTTTDLGLYESGSFMGLLWEIFRHRLYHLIHDKQWRD